MLNHSKDPSLFTKFQSFLLWALENKNFLCLYLYKTCLKHETQDLSGVPEFIVV